MALQAEKKIELREQSRALWLSTIAFTACFAVWTIFSIIGIQIKLDLGLTETQFGLLVGTPILTGSLIRLILGIYSAAFKKQSRNFKQPRKFYRRGGDFYNINYFIF